MIPNFLMKLLTISAINVNDIFLNIKIFFISRKPWLGKGEAKNSGGLAPWNTHILKGEFRIFIDFFFKGPTESAL